MAFLDDLDQAPITSTAIVPVGGHTPTDEQVAIVDAAQNTGQNLGLEALAGAAKTTTLVLMANQPKMARIPTLSLAFNKKIAEEMKARLPANCTSQTLNSLGHRAWAKRISMRLILDTKKNYDILAEVLNKKFKPQDPRRIELQESFSDMLRTLAHGKTQGWVPDSCRESNQRLLDDQSFFGSLDEDLGELIEEILIDCMNASIQQSLRGKIDYDDQIFMSTCFGAHFENYPLTMIDEAQDLSNLNHVMLSKVVGPERLIAVGDPNQAIYAFRGAYGNSMELLQKRFDMRTLELSTSFRCPRSVVREAQWRAPHMKFPDWAEEGSVSTWSDWTVGQLPLDAVIICRNNAPLFSMAIALLIEGRFPELVGNDIGKSLLKVMEKFGDRGIDQEKALKALETYKIKRLSRTRDQAKGSVEDFCRCIEIFLRRADTLGGAISYANHLMNQVGPVKLMTGHKSKGLEFDNVYILDRQLLKVKDEGGKNQDRNLLYVMQTRAKKNLTYIESEGLIMTEGERQ